MTLTEKIAKAQYEQGCGVPWEEERGVLRARFMEDAEAVATVVREHFTSREAVEAGEKALKRAIWGDDYKGPDRDDDWTDETRTVLAAALDPHDVVQVRGRDD